MRRDDIKKSILNVNRAIQYSKIDELADQIESNEEDSDYDSNDILKIFSSYCIEASKFYDTEKYIVNAFGLDFLQDSEFWAIVIGRDKSRMAGLRAFAARVGVFKSAASSFVILLERDADRDLAEIAAIRQDGSKEAVTTGKLESYIRDDASNPITAKQFCSIINDINFLYEQIVRFYEIDHIDLLVGSIDSGSDKSLDLIGISTAISKLSSFLLESWDRIRFSKEQKLEKSFKSVSDGIDLLEKIKQSVDKKTISEQEGESLRRKINKSVDDLFKSGFYTQSMENNSPIKPSMIEVDRRLLLTHAPELSTVDLAKKTKSVDADVISNNKSDSSEENRISVQRRKSAMKRSKAAN